MDVGVEFSSIQDLGSDFISFETWTKFLQKSESELRIPFDSHGQPMCAYSADRKEIN